MLQVADGNTIYLKHGFVPTDGTTPTLRPTATPPRDCPWRRASGPITASLADIDEEKSGRAAVRHRGANAGPPTRFLQCCHLAANAAVIGAAHCRVLQREVPYGKPENAVVLVGPVIVIRGNAVFRVELR
jgi:hypothetical protein